MTTIYIERDYIESNINRLLKCFDAKGSDAWNDDIQSEIDSLTECLRKGFCTYKDQHLKVSTYTTEGFAFQA